MIKLSTEGVRNLPTATQAVGWFWGTPGSSCPSLVEHKARTGSSLGFLQPSHFLTFALSSGCMEHSPYRCLSASGNASCASSTKVSLWRPPSKFKVIASNWELDSAGPCTHMQHEHFNAKVNSSFGVLLGRGKKHTIRSDQIILIHSTGVHGVLTGAW